MTRPDAWPVEFSGVLESVTTTPEPTGRWNVAALGLHGNDDHEPTEPVRARTWGRTRTRRNFERAGLGYVQFTRDPIVFVEASLDVRESDEPVIDSAAAWVKANARAIDEGTVGGTDWVDWELTPVEADVRLREVPRTDRSYGAVVEMTVAASRLGVPAYDDAVLRDRLDYFASVVRSCGGPEARTAVGRIASLSDWQPDEEWEDGEREDEEWEDGKREDGRRKDERREDGGWDDRPPSGDTGRR